MKKHYLITSLLVFVNICFSQNPEIPTDTRSSYVPAAPSVSGLMHFAEIPVNEFTGVPEVSENIFTSKTLSSKINFSMSYAYHPKGISLLEKSSDIGTGWSLNCGGTISRMVMFRPETTSQTNLGYADTYYFNFMGFTGSFQIKYDQNNLNPEVVVKRTDESNLKIEFSKDPNSNKIESFTIFDTIGNRYIFSIYDINVSSIVVDVVSITGENPTGEKPYRIMPYRSSWHLKEVYDTNNKKILNFNYETFTREHNLSSTSNPLIYSLKKLKEVDVIGCSKINLSYTYSAVMDENNSPYFCDAFNLNEIVISDTKNNIIKKVIPEYDYFNFPILERDKVYPSSLNSTPKIRRYLKNIREINASNQEINKTSFSYKLNLPANNLFLDSSGFVNEQEACFVKNPIHWYENYDFDQLYAKYEFALSNKGSSDYGILNGISYKTGGGYELLFETNTFSRTLEHAFSDNSFSKLNDDNKRYDLIYSLDYDTRNRNYIDFVVPNNPISKIYYFKFENESLNIPSQLVGESNPFYDEVQYKLIPNFTLGGDNPEFFSDTMLSAIFNFGESCVGKSLYLTPGTYRINIMMNMRTTGNIKIYEENYNSVPKKYVYGGGNRIKSINKYEKVSISNLQFIEKANLISSTSYEYNNFDNNLISSGELSYGRLGNSMYMDDFSTDYQVNYKNVTKVFNNSQGYTKTRFLLPSERTIGYYSIKNGLHELIQVFDANSRLLKESTNNYTFEQHQSLFYILDWNNTNNNWYPTFIKNNAIISKNYFYPTPSSPANIVQTDETYTYNSLNKKISDSTVRNSIGELMKTKYFYLPTVDTPTSKNNIATIERIENYKNSNLLTTSKINYATNFAGNVSYLPQTITTSIGSNALETRVRYNAYDEFGNPLEVQQESGMLISYIWGYNQTQPIAKIENASYASVQSQVANLQTLSNGTDEGTLITALNNLRISLPNAMVTTYTYKPLVGVSTITDPKGDKITYFYDTFNRIKEVKDKNNNLLSENQYNYRP